MRISIYTALAVMLLTMCACGGTSPATPTDPIQEQVNAQMDAFIDEFIYQMPPQQGREMAALGDYTDMTCVDDFGLPGYLPQFWALMMVQLFNGPNWQDWVHPYNPVIDGRYLFDYFTLYYHWKIGCEYMTYMVEVFENPEYGNNVDVPNVDEVDWPVW